MHLENKQSVIFGIKTRIKTTRRTSCSWAPLIGQISCHVIILQPIANQLFFYSYRNARSLYLLLSSCQAVQDNIELDVICDGNQIGLLCKRSQYYFDSCWTVCQKDEQEIKSSSTYSPNQLWRSLSRATSPLVCPMRGAQEQLVINIRLSNQIIVTENFAFWPIKLLGR